MTLVEVLVAITLLLILGTIVSYTIIQALKTTRVTGDGVNSQSELNDAIARVSRDIAIANPILAVGNSPGDNALSVQTIRAGKCVRIHYSVDATDTSNKKFISETQTLGTADCPDPRTVSSAAKVKKVIVSHLQTSDPSGAPVPLFTYYDKTNTVVAGNPVTKTKIAQIARVQINVGADIRDRKNGVRLLTSVSLRANNAPIVAGNSNAPLCPATFTIAGASDSLSRTITWGYGANTTGYTLQRDGSTIATRVADAATTTYSHTDSGLAYNTAYTYTLIATGPGGSTSCSSVTITPAPAVVPLGVPDVSASVTPATTSINTTGTNPVDVPASTTTLTWPAVTDANAYAIYRRPLNDGTFDPVGTGTYTKITEITGTTYTATGYDDIYEYYVVALNTTDGRASQPSTPDQILTHAARPILNGSVTGYNENTLTWTPGGATTDGYSLYRDDADTAGLNWVLVTNTLPASATSYLHTGVPLGARYNYALVGKNTGPRGDSGTATYLTDTGGVPACTTPTNLGRICGTGYITLQQYPTNPVTAATGTEIPTGGTAQNNPDGQNTASWNSVPKANDYKVREFALATSTSQSSTVDNGTSLTYADTGNPRGTRNYYVASACITNPDWSADLCSPNWVTPTGLAVAYQRPNTPTYSVTLPTLATNATDHTYSLTGDAGEPSDKFCTGTVCSYFIQRNQNGGPDLAVVRQYNSDGGVYNHLAGNAAATATNSGWWGITNDWFIEACNPGGCSNDSAKINRDHYPGPFDITSGSADDWRDYTHWSESTARFDFYQKGGIVVVTHTASAGVRATNAYGTVRKVELGDDPLNLAQSGIYWENAGDTTTPAIPVTAGAAYPLTTTAYAANGLSRPMNFSYSAPPATTGMIESVRYCRYDQRANGWKMAYRFPRAVVTRGAGDPVLGKADGFKSWELVASLDTPSDPQAWYRAMGTVRTLDPAGAADKIGTTATNQYPDNGNGWFSYSNGTTGALSANAYYDMTLHAVDNAWAGGTTGMSFVNGGLGATDNTYMIPNQEGSGGTYLVKSYINKAGIHNTDYGLYENEGYKDTEYLPLDADAGIDAPIGGCTSTGNASWNDVDNWVSRFVTPWFGGGTSGTTNYGAWTDPNTADATKGWGIAWPVP